MLQSTVFVWIVAEKIQRTHSIDIYCGMCTADEASISGIWGLGEVELSEKPLSLAERQCDEHFE